MITEDVRNIELIEDPRDVTDNTNVIAEIDGEWVKINVKKSGLASKKDVETELEKKADKDNAVFTGSISMGRRANTVIGENSFAVGFEVEASGNKSHAEGYGTKAYGFGSHAEGFKSEASKSDSHAEGAGTVSNNTCSHAEGYYTKASGEGSHAEGGESEASGAYSHAEGYGTKASGNRSHSEGYYTEASGNYAHAHGYYAIASGAQSHAEGVSTKSSSTCQHVQGKYNIEDKEKTYAHIVGNGTQNTPSNANTLDWQGNVWYQGSVTSNGADYAEFFEWLGGNPNNEDRIGLLVTLDGEKIKLANVGDEILGIISGTAAVLGDNYECEWNGKYLTDDFGRVIYDEVEEFIDVPVGIDEETGEPIIEKKSVGFFKHPRLNPNYDPEQKYVNRADRPEWDTVGLVGKLYLRHDGTCKVGGYVKPSSNGIATASEDVTNIKVLKVINDEVIRVFLK